MFVFWVVTSCRLVSNFSPEERECMFLRNLIHPEVQAQLLYKERRRQLRCTENLRSYKNETLSLFIRTVSDVVLRRDLFHTSCPHSNRPLSEWLVVLNPGMSNVSPFRLQAAVQPAPCQYVLKKTRTVYHTSPLNKLLLSQLVNKFSGFYATQSFITVFTTAYQRRLSIYGYCTGKHTDG
jgi:hypothetical protein